MRDRAPVGVVHERDGPPELGGVSIEHRRQALGDERDGVASEHGAASARTRNTSSPAPSPVISPTAPVSQNSMPRAAAARAAGAEIVLP